MRLIAIGFGLLISVTIVMLVTTVPHGSPASAGIPADTPTPTTPVIAAPFMSIQVSGGGSSCSGMPPAVSCTAVLNQPFAISIEGTTFVFVERLVERGADWLGA